MPKDGHQPKKEDSALYIAADHAGFLAKKRLVSDLSKNGYTLIDLGAHTHKTRDDYPDYALTLAQVVSRHARNKGILLCGSGQGVCMAANKVPQIRAALAWDVPSARASRRDDDANVLCLSARFLTDHDRERIVLAWLSEQFSQLARHKRRIKKMSAYEKTRR